MTNSRQKGNMGESIACNYLQERGFTIICRNYQKKWGEIDIIGEKDNLLHFFEVKSVTARLGDDPTNSHRPEENVHALKIRHIRRVIETYLWEEHVPESKEFQVHVISVSIDNETNTSKVEMIENIII